MDNSRPPAAERPFDESSTSAVTVRGISKTFGNKEVLKDIDLEISEGSIYGLLGPNGAGKTTLIRILSTLLKPTSGQATVFGLDVTSQAKQVRSNIGLAGQFAAVDGYLTGRENLVMVGRLYNLSRAEAERRADDVLERMRLSDAANKRAATYSGGMERRLDLAASLVGRPRMLFLDEPTTGIDPRSRIDIWELIREMVDGGTTLLLTTQYLEEAEHLAGLIGVIDEGRLIAEGTADQLKDTMGGDQVELTVAGENLDAARQILESIGTDVSSDGKLGRLTVATSRGAADLMEVMRKLEAQKIAPINIGLRRPSLDDVFLRLTDPTNTESSPA